MKFLILFFVLIIKINCLKIKHASNFIVCQSYNYNCSQVINMYGFDKCDVFIKNIEKISKNKENLLITKKGLEILLLFQSDFCNNINITTEYYNFKIYKYNLNNFLIDFKKIENNDIQLQSELYFLKNTLNLNFISEFNKGNLISSLEFYILISLICNFIIIM